MTRRRAIDEARGRRASAGPFVFAPGMGIDKWVRHRLGALQLKLWKRGRTVYRELVARGMTEAAAARDRVPVHAIHG